MEGQSNDCDCDWDWDKVELVINSTNSTLNFSIYFYTISECVCKKRKIRDPKYTAHVLHVYYFHLENSVEVYIIIYIVYNNNNIYIAWK